MTPVAANGGRTGSADKEYPNSDPGEAAHRPGRRWHHPVITTAVLVIVDALKSATFNVVHDVAGRGPTLLIVDLLSFI